MTSTPDNLTKVGQSRMDVPAVRRWAFRTKGLFIIVTSLATAVLGWYVLAKIGEHAQRNPEVIKDLPPLVTSLMNQRAILPVLVLPAFICGVLVLPKNRSRATGWMLIIAATLWLMALFVLILYCFISFLSPLYQYQPL